ncbi:hypothetical protein BH11MYX4_BH11MYX4_19730 [soil metagenome]
MIHTPFTPRSADAAFPATTGAGGCPGPAWHTTGVTRSGDTNDDCVRDGLAAGLDQAVLLAPQEKVAVLTWVSCTSADGTPVTTSTAGLPGLAGRAGSVVRRRQDVHAAHSQLGRQALQRDLDGTPKRHQRRRACSCS